MICLVSVSIMCVVFLQEYLAKLRQIRLQNFNERRMQQEKKGGNVDPKYKVRM